MRRPRADREEKRVTHGRDMTNEERLDPGNPNQRRHLVLQTHIGSAAAIQNCVPSRSIKMFWV